ncbi:hypothetical protein D3Z09_18275 [Rahnella aquatilis]|nr:hypothetical protein D3Z09_18275 [Rahnella aquatilis]
MKPVVPGTDRQISITASGTPAGDRTHNTEQPHEGVRMLTTESTTHRTTTAGTHDTASRLCEAWAWLEAQRQNAPEGADVWDIRWQAQKSTTYLTDLLHTLRAGQYRLSPLQLHGQGNERKAVWGAQDALVLKWVALSMEDRLPLHPACEHIKGHGGGKQFIHRLHALLTGNTGTPDATDTTASKKTADYAWVCRTDIRGYYRHINKQTLLNQVRQHVQDPVLVGLIHQYLHYTVEDGGTFHTPESGISRGCPLSPLMGALHLVEMDEHFSNQKHIHYARYMDDVIILAKTRWSLRKHTKRLMQWFSEYGFEAHPDKTQIGRTRKGFDWMGAWLTHEGVKDIAPRAKANHREKVRRLYERLARVPVWLRHRRQQQVHARVSAYRKRWNIWAKQLLVPVTLTAGVTPLCHANTWNLVGWPTTLASTATRGTAYPGRIDVGAGNTGKATNSGGGARRQPYWGFGQSTNGYYPSFLATSTETGTRVGIVIFPGCKDIAFVPSSVTGVLDDWPYSANMEANQNSYVGVDPIPTNPGFGFINMRNMSVTGSWVLLNDASVVQATCKDTTQVDTTLIAGASTNTNTDITYYRMIVANSSQGLSGSSSDYTQYSALTDVGGTVLPPVVPVSCSITADKSTIDFGDGKGGAQGPINATDINSIGNAYVAAIAPSPLELTATCTGGTGTPKIHGHISWTKSMLWKAGFNGGLPADGDPSAPAMLATRIVAYGEQYNASMFDTMQSPLHFGDDFSLTPNVPKRLYPALLRDNNPVKGVKSGTHTISGTIKVVVD